MSNHSKEGLKLIDLLKNEIGWGFSKWYGIKIITLPHSQFSLTACNCMFSKYVDVLSQGKWESNFLTKEDHKVLYPLVLEKINKLDPSLVNPCAKAINDYIPNKVSSNESVTT